MRCLCCFFLILFCSGVNAVKAEQLYDNGPPGLSDGYEMTHWREADRFVLGQGIIVDHVRYWDFQLSPSAFAGSVVWEIRGNSTSNTPGALLFSGITLNPTRTATGRINIDPLFPVPEYVVTFDTPSLTLPAGSYWLVLHNGPLSNNAGRSLYWEAANNTGTAPSLSDVAPFNSVWGSNSASSAPLSKVSFQLFGAPESAVPRVTAVRRSNGVPRVSFTTAAGQSYRVEYKNALSEQGWTVVTGAENVPGNGGTMEVADSDPAATQITRRFYRVVLRFTPPPAPSAPTSVWRLPTAREPNGLEPAPENSLRSLRARGMLQW